MTVRLVEAEIPPPEAWIDTIPADSGAGIKPGARRRPPPAITDQLKAGVVGIGLWNWSSAIGVNASAPPAWTIAEPGLMAMEVNVGLTVTVTLLVAVRPLGSATVTWNV